MLQNKFILNSHFSIFYLSEKKLKNDLYFKIIEEHSPYRSSIFKNITDFLFCEFFPHWSNLCYKYYNNLIPSLLEHSFISDEVIEAFDLLICDVILESMIQIDFNKISWDQFKQIMIPIVDP